MPDPMSHALHSMPFAAVVLSVCVGNVVVFLLTLAIGERALRVFASRRITPAPPPVTGIEVALALACVTVNAIVTVAGVALWRADAIGLRQTDLLRVLRDSVVLFLVMDGAMYALHRVAHQSLFFALVHRTHHRYENPRPLTLYVLHPLEVLGFGLLWLILIVVYPAASSSIVIYLTLNTAFGLVGHLGVEPMPRAWLRLPVLRLIATSTFHAEHHLDQGHNFGFYTLIWDRLFGTLSPDYAADFARVSGISEPAATR